MFLTKMQSIKWYLLKKLKFFLSLKGLVFFFKQDNNLELKE